MTGIVEIIYRKDNGDIVEKSISVENIQLDSNGEYDNTFISSMLDEDGDTFIISVQSIK